MALSEADYEQFIEAMHADPVLRDRVRNAILADDFLRLPGLVAQLVEHSHEVDRRLDRLTERMDQLVTRMDQLVTRMDQLVGRVDALTTKVDSLDGRVGLLEGHAYEDKYVKHLASHLGLFFRRVRWVQSADLPQLVEALDSGLISVSEWKDVLRLDAMAWAVEKGDSAAGEVLVAMEFSRIVDNTDVERAHRRASILRRVGLPSRACVDGESIRQDSVRLAASLGVRSLVDAAFA